ncbi:glycosyl transferase [Microbacterium sp.]|uniref:glycosyl transferase n=1 Tax=Microbacterium sp. TaxID=51671 RepID=UPI0039E30A12
MRFVWAVVAFVLATVLIGAGIAQRTIFQGPSSEKVTVDVEEPAPFVMLDGAVLRAHPGSQTLLVRGDGDIFAAYGRTADMQAWLADVDYNHVTLNDDGTLDVQLIPASVDRTTTPIEATPAPTEEATPAPVEETTGEDVVAPATGHDPAGSDLWLDQFGETDTLIADNMQLPDGVSMLIAYDGTADAPSDISVSWPLDTSAPLTGPLVTSGVIVLIVGLVLYVLGIRHQRRGRGPLRKGPGPLPITEPLDLAELPAAERAAITRPAASDAPASADAPDAAEPVADDAQGEKPAQEPRTEMRAARPVRRRWALVVPALALTGVLATGCTADSWPQFGAASPTPSPTPSIIVPENQKPPAVTEAQAKRIIGQASATLAEADAAMDIELAKTRLDGPVLAARTAAYAVRAKVPETPVPAAIPTDDVEVVLPEATDRWPRTVLLLTRSEADETVPPVILTMTQADPWSNYKITNIAEMLADTQLPEVVAPWLGTSLVPAESAFLSVAPGKLAEAFSDVIDANEQSPTYGSFDDVALAYATSIRDSRQAIVQNLADNDAAETSKVDFDIAPADVAPVSMTTLDSGAIVAVTLIESQSVTPTTTEAVIRFGDNPEAKALTGVSESAKGVTTTYEFQLFFAVPAQGSTEQIHLLGARQSILSVEVIK